MIGGVGAALSGNPAIAVPLLFVAGVATSLSPCIYPMIPVTASIVGGLSAGGAQARRPRPVLLTLSYVAGLSAVYALLGLLAGLTGTLFGTVSASPWAALVVANLFLLFALVTLEAIPFRLPAGVSGWAARLGHGRSAGGALLLGAASGLVVAPCSAPAMAAVLTWVGTTRSAVLGFAYLLVFSLGMCTVLVAVGLSGALLARLPRSGPWLLLVKRALALVMIVAAEYYLIQAGKALI
jgi:thiol:disulfide interchange protein DsbD